MVKPLAHRISKFYRQKQLDPDAFVMEELQLEYRADESKHCVRIPSPALWLIDAINYHDEARNTEFLTY